MNELKSCVALCAILSLFGAGLAQAQQQPAGPLVTKIDGGLATQADADLEDSNGSFSVNRWFISAGLDYVWDARNSLGISFGAGESSYDFSDLAGPDPWGTVENQRLSLVGRFGFGDRGMAIIIPSYRYNGDKDSDSGEARTWGLLAGAAWRLSEDLTIGPGIGVFSEIEDDSRVFPILVIDWNFAERWNLSTGRGLAASQGPGLTLSWQATPAWSFGLSGRYEDTRFRLSDQAPEPNGIGRDTVFPLVLSANWKPHPKIGASLFAGAGFFGKLELRDPDGVTLEKSDYATAPLFGATFDLRF